MAVGINCTDLICIYSLTLMLHGRCCVLMVCSCSLTKVWKNSILMFELHQTHNIECVPVLSSLVMFLTCCLIFGSHCISIASGVGKMTLIRSSWIIKSNAQYMGCNVRKLYSFVNDIVSSLQHALHCSFYRRVNHLIDLKSIHSAFRSIFCLYCGRFQRNLIPFHRELDVWRDNCGDWLLVLSHLDTRYSKVSFITLVCHIHSRSHHFQFCQL